MKEDNNPAGAGRGSAQQYLTFRLRGELYGIEILKVKEIIEYGGVTKVPRMPDCVAGIINLRGSVVPVIDLGKRFSHRASEITAKTCIVIAEIVEQDKVTDVGVIVDAVNEVAEIADADTEPAPAFGGRIRQDFIASIGKLDERFVIVLSVDKVLDVDEIADLQDGLEAMEGAEAA